MYLTLFCGITLVRDFMEGEGVRLSITQNCATSLYLGRDQRRYCAQRELNINLGNLAKPAPYLLKKYRMRLVFCMSQGGS
ncbi:unknown protein [Desulfotalea psychrophila LSv54]|uniref:Uncharacterized protein n=1 Tax=Desulfotalea psychrophila (strain LSv54 / DSM 12343) TaxID=177439 RepID=Q6AKF8_DESPS|nr:unknown protein [Desulfotalea psychrophila LSv54]